MMILGQGPELNSNVRANIFFAKVKTGHRKLKSEMFYSCESSFLGPEIGVFII